ncbi:MAG: class I SAM-dependent methyltransferase [Candidatus Omnitrophica bacterium]|nr:class I SAM-dependent methyltransferase [Candidatus Omnitrophota bacterium]
MARNKEFWKNQAKEHKADIEAVNFDPLQEELELHFLRQFIGENEAVLDVGCGNGRTLMDFAVAKKNSMFYGIDYTDEMIAIANERKISQKIDNVNFQTGDASSDNLGNMFKIEFDKIISKRLLINLKGENKYKAVKNIHSMLKKKGTYIMVECFVEPLASINTIRKTLGLEEIKVKHFNEYLNYGFLDEIKGLFKIAKQIDFESLYYFTSRIYNACLSKGEKLDYHAPVNEMAVQLIKSGVNGMPGYSPEIIFLLEKV